MQTCPQLCHASVRCAAQKCAKRRGWSRKDTHREVAKWQGVQISRLVQRLRVPSRSEHQDEQGHRFFFNKEAGQPFHVQHELHEAKTLGGEAQYLDGSSTCEDAGQAAL